MPENLPFEPAPDGPPPDQRRGVANAALYEWLAAHPGEWAVIKGASNGPVITFKKRGYEVTTRPAPNQEGKVRYDIYIRTKPTESSE